MAHIIQIGNSHGIRIPKNVIQQAGLADVELMLTVVPEGLLITPIHSPRDGWAEAFKAAASEKNEEKLMPDLANKFDAEDWEW